MTPGDRAEVQKMIQQAILEERERVANAALMAAGSKNTGIYPPEWPAWLLSNFGRRLRGKEGE